jgi:hypothetical protein
MGLKVKATRSVGINKKQGRLDHLLIGVAARLGTEIEARLNLPGLSDALQPLAKKEIGRLVPRGNVIPTEFRKLVKLVGEKV